MVVEVEEQGSEDEQILEEDTSQSPLLILANWRFLMGLSDADLSPKQRAEVQAKTLAYVLNNNMAPYYKFLCSEFKWTIDQQELARMEARNAEDIKQLDALIADAEENLGTVEVRDATFARAKYIAHIGDRERGMKAYEETLEKTVGAGGRIDVVFAMVHLALFWNDTKLLVELIEKAKVMVEKGGDWERRNLLGVYNGIVAVSLRKFSEATTLLLAGLATFTCYQLCDYNTFVFHSVLTSLLTLDRVALSKKVVKAPEILSVIGEVPHLRELLFSLYHCKYNEFLKALALITPSIRRDRYLAPHTGFYLREIRVVAYAQFLESYSSVTLASMARAFGVSVQFLDSELSRFIAAGRLNAKIDKVGGIVETNRPDQRNTQYQQVLKDGDALLNKIQKLTKVIDV